MKYILVFLLLAQHLYGTAQQPASPDSSRTDKRVELLSIVFRLAGRPEYGNERFKLYTDRIGEHFGRFKDHELIRYTRSLIDSRDISYDAPMSLAIHLNGDLNLLPGSTMEGLRARWSSKDVNKFIRLLKRFSEDTGFDRFYESNADLRTEAGKRFLPVSRSIDPDWFSRFYGKDPEETFIIVNALGNGTHNYGPSVSYRNGKKEVYAIVSSWFTDSTGMPEYPVGYYLPILVHEFNHSFGNHLTEKYRTQLEKSGKELFSTVSGEMSSKAYGTWEIMMNEALVRAATIIYLKDHQLLSQEQATKEIEAETWRGFLWMPGLVGELENYANHRDLYPTLEDYMPRLAEAYKTYAKNVKLFDSKRPRVTSISEFSNGSQNVSPQIKTITFNFDRPLSGKGYSVYMGSKGKEAFPVLNNISYTNDNRSVMMEVSLEPDKEYQFTMKGTKFRSAEGFGIKDYEVNFRTGK